MKFTDTLPESPSQDWKRHWDEIATELQDNPGQWGLIEENVKIERSSTIRHNLKKRGTFTVAYRQGTIYGRFDG